MTKHVVCHFPLERQTCFLIQTGRLQNQNQIKLHDVTRLRLSTKATWIDLGFGLKLSLRCSHGNHTGVLT